MKAKTEENFVEAVQEILSEVRSATTPDQGWPWPWESSHLTDYTYTFDDGRVYLCCFGSKWHTAARYKKLSKKLSELSDLIYSDIDEESDEYIEAQEEHDKIEKEIFPKDKEITGWPNMKDIQ